MPLLALVTCLGEKKSERHSHSSCMLKRYAWKEAYVVSKETCSTTKIQVKRCLFHIKQMLLRAVVACLTTRSCLNVKRDLFTRYTSKETYFRHEGDLQPCNGSVSGITLKETIRKFELLPCRNISSWPYNCPCFWACTKVTSQKQPSIWVKSYFESMLRIFISVLRYYINIKKYVNTCKSMIFSVDILWHFSQSKLDILIDFSTCFLQNVSIERCGTMFNWVQCNPKNRIRI